MLEIPAFAYDYSGNHDMMGFWGTSSMGIWMIGLLVIPILIIFLILYLALIEEKPRQIHPIKYAPAILDERYARGEIARDEYFQMRNDLTEIREADSKFRARK